MAAVSNGRPSDENTTTVIVCKAKVNKSSLSATSFCPGAEFHVRESISPTVLNRKWSELVLNVATNTGCNYRDIYCIIDLKPSDKNDSIKNDNLVCSVRVELEPCEEDTTVWSPTVVTDEDNVLFSKCDCRTGRHCLCGDTRRKLLKECRRSWCPVGQNDNDYHSTPAVKAPVVVYRKVSTSEFVAINKCPYFSWTSQALPEQLPWDTECGFNSCYIVVEVIVWNEEGRNSCELAPVVGDVTDDMRELLHSEMLADCTLLVENKSFPCHKCILAARSPVFAAMFRHDMKETVESQVIIDDASAKGAEMLLSFIYTGSTEDLDLFAEQVLPLAVKYHFPSLVHLCATNLERNLTVKRVLNALLMADIYALSRLKQKALGFLRRNFKSVMEDESWINTVNDRWLTNILDEENGDFHFYTNCNALKTTGNTRKNSYT